MSYTLKVHLARTDPHWRITPICSPRQVNERGELVSQLTWNTRNVTCKNCERHIERTCAARWPHLELPFARGHLRREKFFQYIEQLEPGDRVRTSARPTKFYRVVQTKIPPPAWPRNASGHWMLLGGDGIQNFPVHLSQIRLPDWEPKK